MDPIHLAPAVSGSSGPRYRQKDLPVPVKPLPELAKRKLPAVPVKPAGKAPKTKCPIGMIPPIKAGVHGAPLSLIG